METHYKYYKRVMIENYKASAIIMTSILNERMYENGKEKHRLN